jgi:hypothetical protein
MPSAYEPVKLIRLDQSVRPTHYQISLTIDPEAAAVAGKVVIAITLPDARSAITLHAKDLDIHSIEVRSAASPSVANWREISTDGTIEVALRSPIGPGLCEFVFDYTAPLNRGLEGLYKVIDDGASAVFTQFEAIGARRAFPCFDEPGFKANFDIELTAPKTFQAISNTLELNTVAHKNGMISHQFATTKPLPTYLIFFAVGRFDIVNSAPVPKSKLREKPIPVRGIAMKGKGDDLAIALKYTAPLVLLEEEYFDIAYPFDKLDVIAIPDFGAGGMENAGAIAYDEAYVLLPNHSGIEERRELLSIHAHEIAHHWFGNLVSPKWWDDLWLNESFATLMEYKFAHMIEPTWQFDTDIIFGAHEAMLSDQVRSVRRVHEPVDSVDGISAAFDTITYQKGAMILAVAENAVGKQTFQNIVRKFLKSQMFGTMTTDSFLSMFESGAGALVAHSIESGISETGVPISDGVEFHDGMRYAALDLSLRNWSTQFQNFSTFNRSQALAVAASLDVALFAGRVDFNFYIKAVAQISQYPDWQVSGFPLTRLTLLSHAQGVIASTTLKAIDACYGERIRNIDLKIHYAGRTVATWQKQIEREALVLACAKTGTHPQFQAQLAELGMQLARRKRISLHDNPLAPYDVARGALIAAAILKGEEFLELALIQFKNELSLSDEEVWLSAIAASHAESSSKAISDLLLTNDIRNQEVPELLHARAEYPKFHDTLWDTVSRNSDVLLRRLDGDLDVTLIELADVFASGDLELKVQQTITPLLGNLRGGAVRLEQTLETIRLNTALLNRATNAMS